MKNLQVAIKLAKTKLENVCINTKINISSVNMSTRNVSLAHQYRSLKIVKIQRLHRMYHQETADFIADFCFGHDKHGWSPTHHIYT